MSKPLAHSPTDAGVVKSYKLIFLEKLEAILNPNRRMELCMGSPYFIIPYCFLLFFIIFK